MHEISKPQPFSDFEYFSGNETLFPSEKELPVGNVAKHGRLDDLIYIYSESKLKLRRKRGNKIIKIQANYDQISVTINQHRHNQDFLCLRLINY